MRRSICATEAIANIMVAKTFIAKLADPQSKSLNTGVAFSFAISIGGRPSRLRLR